ncbi:hypothetical protein [Leucobacter sp.]
MAFRIAEDESLVVLTVAPKTEMDGTHKTDRDGVPLWTLQTLHTPETGKAALINITMPAARQPEVQPMSHAPIGVEVDHYAVPASEGRAAASGLFFRCSDLVELEG